MFGALGGYGRGKAFSRFLFPPPRRPREPRVTDMPPDMSLVLKRVSCSSLVIMDEWADEEQDECEEADTCSVFIIEEGTHQTKGGKANEIQAPHALLVTVHTTPNAGVTQRGMLISPLVVLRHSRTAVTVIAMMHAGAGAVEAERLAWVRVCIVVELRSSAI